MSGDGRTKTDGDELIQRCACAGDAFSLLRPHERNANEPADRPKCGHSFPARRWLTFAAVESAAAPVSGRIIIVAE